MSNSSDSRWPDNITFIPAAADDFLALDRSRQIQVAKAIVKVASNPYPQPRGYGKPLGRELTGYLKIKLRDAGIRIIYRLEPPDSNQMRVVIIGMRSDDEVYEDVFKRI